MADASSSDTTSDCCNECFSDITSEKSEYVVVGRKPCPSHRRSKRNLLQKLLIREVGRPDVRATRVASATDRPSGQRNLEKNCEILIPVDTRSESRERGGLDVIVRSINPPWLDAKL